MNFVLQICDKCVEIENLTNNHIHMEDNKHS
jgi:hypothetical protein